MSKKQKKAQPNSWQPKDPHVKKAMAYCLDVVSGKIPAGRYAVLACRRQIEDIDRWQRNARWPFEFSEAKAGRICRFIEALPHIKGDLAGQPIRLEPWQCFNFSTPFGWLVKATGKRRFRRATTFVSRGNAKSTGSSGIGNYCAFADGEGGAEVYSAATTRDQAGIVHGDAQQMLRKAHKLRATLGVDVSQHIISQPSSGSSFKRLSREADNLDGLNIHCAIIDEIHAHKTRDLLDVIETGLGKRSNSLLWIISTAGSNTSGIGYEVYTYARKVLEGSAKDESQFAVIWEADPEDDPWEEKTWVKANPNWGISVRPEVVRQLAVKAQQVLSAQSAFLTKHLGRWVTAYDAAFDLRAWDRCADPDLSPDQFEGEQCVLGLDLASTTDIAAKAKLFWKSLPVEGVCVCGKKEEEHLAEFAPTTPTYEVAEAAEDKCEGFEQKSLRHYYLFVDSYLPEAAVESARNSQYEGWALEGRIKTTPGDVLDFDAVKADVLEDRDRHNVVEVGYDPWQAQKLANELGGEGMTMVVIRPTVENFNAPMKELDALMRTGRLHHDGNPAMRWMISNVVAHTDAKDNIYPRKQRPENKIDGPVAAITALNRAMVQEDNDGPAIVRL